MSERIHPFTQVKQKIQEIGNNVRSYAMLPGDIIFGLHPQSTFTSLRIADQAEVSHGLRRTLLEGASRLANVTGALRGDRFYHRQEPGVSRYVNQPAEPIVQTNQNEVIEELIANAPAHIIKPPTENEMELDEMTIQRLTVSQNQYRIPRVAPAPAYISSERSSPPHTRERGFNQQQLARRESLNRSSLVENIISFFPRDLQVTLSDQSEYSLTEFIASFLSNQGRNTVYHAWHELLVNHANSAIQNSLSQGENIQEATYLGGSMLVAMYAALSMRPAYELLEPLGALLYMSDQALDIQPDFLFMAYRRLKGGNIDELMAPAEIISPSFLTGYMIGQVANNSLLGDRETEANRITNDFRRMFLYTNIPMSVRRRFDWGFRTATSDNITAEFDDNRLTNEFYQVFALMQASVTPDLG